MGIYCACKWHRNKEKKYRASPVDSTVFLGTLTCLFVHSSFTQMWSKKSTCLRIEIDLIVFRKDIEKYRPIVLVVTIAAPVSWHLVNRARDTKNLATPDSTAYRKRMAYSQLPVVPHWEAQACLGVEAHFYHRSYSGDMGKRISIWGQPWTKIQDLIWKIKQKRAGGMAQVVPA
jgi:hypothetical protein